jgi:hypothetical protein
VARSTDQVVEVIPLMDGEDSPRRVLCPWRVLPPVRMNIRAANRNAVRSQSVRDFVTEISGGATPAPPPVRCGSEL